MNERNKRRRTGGTISEEDISTIFQRYSATTVLALLQEVALSPGVKIDWKSLVKKTTTGISNAREYQMLWRHLAYRHGLDKKIEDAAEPLEDDSDLEFEVDASPPVSAEASAEAAACVKVLMASGLPSELNVANGSTVEASLTINIPNCKSSKAYLGNALPASSIQGTNIIVPVSIQKQPPAGIVGGGETNGTVISSQVSRKKRKPWSEQEDLELIAAVKKCGEGNWANILKGDFKGERTASQLSQRWQTIRRKHSSLSIGGTNLNTPSEAQLATRRAIDMALKDNNFIPASGNMSSNCVAASGAVTASNHAAVNASTEDHPCVLKDIPSQQQSHPQVVISSSTKATVPGPQPKSKPPAKKMPAKLTISPDSMVKAAAVAAGARIASPSEANIIKAAQSKKAVYFSGAIAKPPVSGNASLLPSSSIPGHPNVHIFRNSPVPAAPSHIAAGNHQVKVISPRPASPSLALPQSVKSASVVTTTVPTPSPLSAGNHQLQSNIPKPATPSVPVTQPVKPGPGLAASTSSSVPPLQPLQASAAIARPGIQQAQTMAAGCVSSTEQGKPLARNSGLVHIPVSNTTASISSATTQPPVKAAGNISLLTISSVLSPSTACNPPLQPRGKQSSQAAGPIPVHSSIERDTDPHQDLASPQKSNPDQLAPKLVKMEKVDNQPTTDHATIKGDDVTAKESEAEVCCSTVQDKDADRIHDSAVGRQCEPSMNGNSFIKLD